MKRTMVLAVLLVAPVFAAAQGAVELTPTVGMRWGGELDTGYSDVFGVDVDVEEGESYGLVFDIDLNRYLFLELLSDFQSTELGTGENAVSANRIALDFGHTRE